MQEKTIKSVLRRKVDDWCANIDDQEVKKAIQQDTVITGGAIVSLLTGEEVNDFDVYFKTKETTKIVAQYYVKKFKENPPSSFKDHTDHLVSIDVTDDEGRIRIVVKSQGVAGESGTKDYQYFEGVNDPSEPDVFVEPVEGEKKAKYRPRFLTTNAITLSDKIQLVIRFYGSPDEIHENYDFVHCTCSWEASSGELRLPNAALISIMNKRLKYKTSKYPLCSFIRTRKFLKRGWHIDAGQFLKMAWDLNKLVLKDMAVLEDQLTGVDAAYFHEVIGLLNERIKGGKKIDDSYLVQVVDKIFG